VHLFYRSSPEPKRQSGDAKTVVNNGIRGRFLTRKNPLERRGFFCEPRLGIEPPWPVERGGFYGFSKRGNWWE
jgi:hypothetical protein